MGQNIGTCITAILSAIGASKNAKRAALVHLYFNLIGTILFMIGFYAINATVGFPFLTDSANAAGIAIVHSVFNVTATVILLPFSDKLEKLACLTIREDAEIVTEESEADKDFRLLDLRFLDTPGLAVEHCRRVAENMAKYTKEAIYTATEIITEYDRRKAERVMALEKEIDRYEDKLGTYMVKLSQQQLSENDSHRLSVILHCLSDFERISDHAVNLVESAQEMREKKQDFSKKAKEELAVFTQAVKDIVAEAFEVFEKEDITRAAYVEPLEEVIDDLQAEVKKRHVKRLQKGKCTIEMGFILEDILIGLERVSDHCSNIAVEMITIYDNDYNTHEYFENFSSEERASFNEEYEELLKRYPIGKHDGMVTE
jgi:phosphate:Na+ symporter